MPACVLLSFKGKRKRGGCIVETCKIFDADMSYVFGSLAACVKLGLLCGLEELFQESTRYFSSVHLKYTFTCSSDV